MVYELTAIGMWHVKQRHSNWMAPLKRGFWQLFTPSKTPHTAHYITKWWYKTSHSPTNTCTVEIMPRHMHVQIEQTKDVVLAYSVYMPAGRRAIPSTSHAVYSHSMQSFWLCMQCCNGLLHTWMHVYLVYDDIFSHSADQSREPYVVHHNTNTPFTSKNILLCLPSQSTAQFVLLQSAGIRDWFTHTAGQLRKGIVFINTYVKRRTNSQKIHKRSHCS